MATPKPSTDEPQFGERVSADSHPALPTTKTVLAFSTETHEDGGHSTVVNHYVNEDAGTNNPWRPSTIVLAFAVFPLLIPLNIAAWVVLLGHWK